MYTKSQIHASLWSLQYALNLTNVKCIRNWPLPIRAFQDQCKQTVINKYSNKHNLQVKNPNWREADQLAIYKLSLELNSGLPRSASTSGQLNGI